MSLFKRKDAEEDENQDTQEEAEEALSLRDLPIDRGMKLEDISNTADPTAPDQELFEFFNNFNSEMCAADDIFLCGMLLPYKSSLSTKTHNEEENRSFLHMRSESFDETRRSSAKCRIMRSSLSVDCRKLERDWSSSASSSSMAKNTQMTYRVPSEKCELSSGRRPKWYLLMFGSMRSPAEMEMKDIRNRLRRRDPRTTVLFPELEKRGREVAVGKEEGKTAWKLLRALSCKGHANAVVTPSFGSIQHVPSM